MVWEVGLAKDIRKYYPVEDIGLDLDSLSIDDLEDIANRASKYLEEKLRYLVGREVDYLATVSVVKDDVVNVLVDVEIHGRIGLSLEVEIDRLIDEVFKYVRDELIKRSHHKRNQTIKEE